MSVVCGALRDGNTLYLAAIDYGGALWTSDGQRAIEFDHETAQDVAAALHTRDFVCCASREE